MTPEELCGLIECREVEKLVAALAPLDERQRAALYRAVKPLHRTALETCANRDVVGLAVLGTGPLAAARSYHSISEPEFAAAMGQVLLDRHPAWLVEWLDSRWQIAPWAVLEPLFRAGYLSPTMADHVYWIFVDGVGWPAARIVPKLLERPEWLECVYGIFHGDRCPFTYYQGKLQGHGPGWLQAIRQLTAEGHLDRQRLLVECVRAMLNDCKVTTLQNLTRVHDDFEPTEAECKGLEDDYRSLLGSPVSAVVAFALRQLQMLAKRDALDGPGYVGAFPRVLSCSVKGHVKTALTLLKTVVAQQPELRAVAAQAAAEALAHPQEDTQEAALTLLETWAEPEDCELRAQVANYRDSVAAPLRARLEALFDSGGSAAVVAPPVSVTPCEASPEGRLPVGPSWDLMKVCVLSGLEPIVPIQSVDELFDAVGRGLEVIDHGDEVERILDGISRLCDQRPADFARRAAPLVARIRKILTSQSAGREGLLAFLTNRAMTPVLLAWLTGSASFDEYGYHMAFCEDGWRRAAQLRLGCLAARVARPVAAPLLAAPTHRGGWIDPLVWAERWRCLNEQSIEVPQEELLQSLLRLAPDHREAARQRIEAVDCRRRDALVWALGGSARPDMTHGSAALWGAAARCRDPHVDLREEAWAQALPPGPDARQPATYRWSALTGKRRWNGFQFVFDREAKDPVLELTLEPSLESRDNAAQLAMMSHTCDVICAMPRWVYHWMAMLWPAKLDGYWKAAAKAFLARLDTNASSLHPHGAFLDALLWPDQPLSELAALALWIATETKDADSRTAALDAWTTLIADGRANTEQLASVLIRLAPSGWLYLNRVAETLREVSRVSPLHAWTVAEILEDFLESQGELPGDAHHLLQLLRELLVQLGRELRPALRTRFASEAAGGKTLKLLRELAKLAATPRPEPAEALRQLQEARQARAERWAEAMPG